MPRWSSFDQFLNDALNEPLEARQALVNALLKEHPNWPWVQGPTATFVYARTGADTVAVSLDSIKKDPPFVPMENLAGTTLWHVTLSFQPDDLLDYMLIVNDPMTPLSGEPDLETRIHKHWLPDPYNSTRISMGGMNVSVLRLEEARPFPDWSKLMGVNHGTVTEHTIDSTQLNFTGRKLWVYTPAGYEESDRDYPLLILLDGQWANGPLQVPAITDALIKHGRMEPVVIAMFQAGDQVNRIKTLISNDRHYLFLLTELLPFVQTQYRIDGSNLGVGGFGESAIAAAHAALSNPAVFAHLIMVSPPLGKGTAEDKLREYADRFEHASALPRRIFQSVGRYEINARYRLPAYLLRTLLIRRHDTDYKFVEIGSGHGLTGFRSVLPEAISWVYPAEAAATS
jgi:enterochelin esterase-like enzyme